MPAEIAAKTMICSDSPWRRLLEMAKNAVRMSIAVWTTPCSSNSEDLNVLALAKSVTAQLA